MRAFFRYFWLPVYRRWALRHMQREQSWKYAGLQLHIPPGVFHPGIFFSSPIFISFLQKVDFQDKKVLDVGTGSGLLALFAARKGGLATGLDIHPLAVETARNNARLNGFSSGTSPVFLQSDLFEALPAQVFDIVLVNPPYYPRAAGNLAEHAFFAGENLEYFERFFARIQAYTHPHSKVWMILSEDCDIVKIKAIATKNRLFARSVLEKRKWGERFYILQIDPV